MCIVCLKIKKKLDIYIFDMFKLLLIIIIYLFFCINNLVINKVNGGIIVNKFEI